MFALNIAENDVDALLEPRNWYSPYYTGGGMERPILLLRFDSTPRVRIRTEVIWRKVDSTFVPERYVRSMFPKRAGHKLVAQITESRRGWMQRISGARSQ